MNSCRISRVPHYSGAVCRCRRGLRLRGFHPLWPAFPSRSADLMSADRRRSYNPVPAVTGTVWAPARSLATTCAITVVFFSSGYLDVSVPRVSLTLCVIPSKWWVAPFGNLWLLAGICPWPQLIAACHVLRRIREPRHPSCALFSFPFRLDFSPVYALPLLRQLGCKCFCVGMNFVARRFIDARSFVCLDSFDLLVFAKMIAHLYASSMSMFSFCVENNGFEPLTPCLQSRCSSQLS